MTDRPRITRRQLVVGAVAAAGLAACDNVRSKAGAPQSTAAGDAATTGPAASPEASTAPAAAAPTAQSATAPATTASAATTAATAPSGPAAFVNHGARTDQRVALTFHASGDAGLATQLLDELQARHTHVTVFGVGQWLDANPQLVARMIADGHELANHTFSHQSMGQLSASRIAEEIAGCAQVLTKLTGSISAWFRPSGIEVPTDAILSAAGKAGYPVSVGYDVDSLDFEDPGTAAIEANVRKSVQAGSIVSLHFGHKGTVEAIGAVLDHLSSVGLQTATVGQLLA